MFKTNDEYTQSMKPAGAYNPFTLRPSQIWSQLDARQKTALTILYQVNLDSECLEYHRLKREGRCRPPDEWRWIAFTARCRQAAPCPQAAPLLQARLREAGLEPDDALEIFRGLEMRGLIRCLQDRWADDDRLGVRIQFLGQRVVRAGQTLRRGFVTADTRPVCLRPTP